MRLFPWRRNSESEPIRLFYFHLDALQTSVIHPKFMSDKLVAGLNLSEADQEYAASIDHSSPTARASMERQPIRNKELRFWQSSKICAKTSRRHSSTTASAFTNWKNFKQLSSQSATDRLSSYR